MSIDMYLCSLHADDTLLCITGDTIEHLQDNLLECICEVEKWYNNNLLVINASKSNVMVITTKQKALHNCNMDINTCLGSTPLKQVSCTDYIGIQFDQYLLWIEQVDNLGKIMFFYHITISQVEKFTQPTHDDLHVLLNYSTTSNQNIRKIQLLQNRTARIITGNYDYINIRGIDLVRQLKWMTITQRRDYFTSLMMFKCVHGMAPNYLCDSITLHKDIANRITRRCKQSTCAAITNTTI